MANAKTDITIGMMFVTFIPTPVQQTFPISTGLPRAGIELMDFKFTKEVPETFDPFQLQLYALGLKEITGSTADTLSFYYLRQGSKISFTGGDGAIQEGKERTAELRINFKKTGPSLLRPTPGVARAVIGSTA